MLAPSPFAVRHRCLHSGTQAVRATKCAACPARFRGTTAVRNRAPPGMTFAVRTHMLFRPAYILCLSLLSATLIMLDVPDAPDVLLGPLPQRPPGPQEPTPVRPQPNAHGPSRTLVLLSIVD